MFIMPYLGCDATTTTWLFITFGVLAGASWSSTGPALIQMSPNYVGQFSDLYDIHNEFIQVPAGCCT
jgi:hypothetical protein